MNQNKKNLIILGVVSFLIIIYLVLFNLSPKNQEPLIAKCEDKPLNLDPLTLCLQEVKELSAQEDLTRVNGKVNECIAEMKNLHLQKSGYEIPDKVNTDFKFKTIVKNISSDVASSVDGLHVVLPRSDKLSMNPCFMNVLDPKIEDTQISFIPAEAKSLIVCYDLAQDQHIVFHSSDWDDSLSDVISQELIQLKQDAQEAKKLDVPPSNAVSP